MCSQINSPFRAASMPPVAAPLMIEFQGSSFFRKWTNVQSIVLNMPPQTAKFPAMMGDRVLMAIKLPNYRQHKLSQFSILSMTNLKCKSYRSPVKTGRRVPEPLDRLEDAASNAAHRKGASAVVHDAIRTRFSGILFHVDWVC